MAKAQVEIMWHTDMPERDKAKAERIIKTLGSTFMAGIAAQIDARRPPEMTVVSERLFFYATIRENVIRQGFKLQNKAPYAVLVAPDDCELARTWLAKLQSDPTTIGF